MSLLGDKINELKAEMEQARRKGNHARVMELSSRIEKLEVDYKKQQQQLGQYGTITPANMPPFIDVSAIPKEKEKANRKAVRELFWESDQLESEAPEKNKSFNR